VLSALKPVIVRNESCARVCRRNPGVTPEFEEDITQSVAHLEAFNGVRKCAINPRE
jgi:hypothetical protein